MLTLNLLSAFNRKASNRLRIPPEARTGDQALRHQVKQARTDPAHGALVQVVMLRLHQCLRALLLQAGILLEAPLVHRSHKHLIGARRENQEVHHPVGERQVIFNFSCLINYNFKGIDGIGLSSFGDSRQLKLPGLNLEEFLIDLFL